MKSVEDAICAKGEQIKKDIETLENLPEFGFEAVAVYKSTLDMNKAISEAQRMSQIAKAKAEHEAEIARQKAEAEAKAQEGQISGQASFTDQKSFEECMNKPVQEEKESGTAKQWISFVALLSTEDALALKAFFESRNIEFKAVHA